MNGVRPRLHTWSLLVLAAAAAGVNVLAVSLFSVAAPYVGFLDLARAALPGVAMAVAAGFVVLLARATTAPAALLLGSVALAAPDLSVGLQQRWEGWVAVGALGALFLPSVVAWSLTYSDGRPPARAGRPTVGLVFAVGVVAAAGYAATYDPSAWSWCRCLGNPLALGTRPDIWIRTQHALVVSEGVVTGVGIAAMVSRRLRGAPPRRDLALAGVLAVLLVSWTATDAMALSPAGGPPSLLLDVRDVAVVLLPILYVARCLTRRPSRAHVADLLLAAREQHDPAHLQALVARALGDPSTVVGWWDVAAREYRDHRGRPVRMPDNGVLSVADGGRPIATVISGELDLVDAGVRGSVVEALSLAAENRRLASELKVSLEQVRDSRARILTASDEARRRMERDIHDGAQQLLISTGIKLNLAAARAERGDARELKKMLGEASAELGLALAELRSLAGGIAPTALVHGSVAHALQELALRSTVPTTVRATGTREPGELVGATAYFFVAECLTNVAKHAGAARARVELELTDPLRVSVTDDGHGGAGLDTVGSGLRGLLDRIEARGGSLDLSSSPTGTRVTATLPDERATSVQP